MQTNFHLQSEDLAPQAKSLTASGKKNFARAAPTDPEARTAGSLHTATFLQSARQTSLNRLAQASNPEQSFDTALAYAANGNVAAEHHQAEDDGYDFYDVLDVVNPLQHIPLVSTLYRGITGDEIKPAAKIIGGSIYGGPVGAVTSTVNVVVEHETGRDIAGNALALVAGDVIREPVVITSDKSRELLGFDNGARTALSNTHSKTNFSAATSSYQKASHYNS